MMSHCGRFLRSPGLGLDLLIYLDDLIFAAPTARDALRTAQTMIHVLRRFGWLIHPTKCTGVLEAVQVFRALGTVVDLATQLYSVPAETVDSILRAASALATGPPMAPVWAVAAAAPRQPSSARAVAHTIVCPGPYRASPGRMWRRALPVLCCCYAPAE